MPMTNPGPETRSPMREAWPYLTADIPPVPVVFKARETDFQVDEIPLYDPCGVGAHLYVRIEKTGLSTRRAVSALARALELDPRAIGVAGQKDARGVTRQLLSLEGVDPARLRTLRIPGLTVLEHARHRTKLRLGALRGNRFQLRLREVPAGRHDDVRRVLALLARRGVPNYFGPQRFGTRGDTGEIGRALLAGDHAGALARIPGLPVPPDANAARRAAFALDRRSLGFYVSAYQAWLFNAVLARRMPEPDRLLPGDVAVEQLTGRLLHVGDPAAEQPRADRFELSPTGPILGHAMLEPRDEAAALERQTLETSGLPPGELPRTGPLKCVGARRALRVRVEEIEVEAGQDPDGPFLEVRFALPAGGYATALLREIGKQALRDHSEAPAQPE
jgi:tRNA pseudouridine13 synthase